MSTNVFGLLKPFYLIGVGASVWDDHYDPKSDHWSNFTFAFHFKNVVWNEGTLFLLCFVIQRHSTLSFFFFHTFYFPLLLPVIYDGGHQLVMSYASSWASCAHLFSFFGSSRLFCWQAREQKNSGKFRFFINKPVFDLSFSSLSNRIETF